MQGISTFAILVLFVCAQPWAGSAQMVQPCTFVKDGAQVGDDVMEEQDYIPEEEGADVRIYIPGTEDLNVVGSSLLFCDDEVDDAVIELAQDKKSYLVHRQTETFNDSFYQIKLFISNGTLKARKALALRKRPLQLRRPYY